MGSSQKPIEQDFDFNEWAALARTDPEGFARRRLAWIQVAISSAQKRNHARLERLQFRIDAKRRFARTPMKACLQLSSMMWDSFFDMKESLASFSEQQRFQACAKAANLKVVRNQINKKS
ncbi:MAG: DUF3135 domain-containing protein [Betaproteobacteria bacterium]|nr:DUF3135 domain-containing protein [Betaproteobacteria bacterium]